MKKILGIVIFSLLLNEKAFACAGDFYTGLFDFSKEHKICGKYARSLNVDSFRQTDAYCDCRERLDNKKKYGIEKIFD